MIKAIAIDDEKNALGVIQEYVMNTEGIELIDTFTDPLKVLNFLDTHPGIDLVFLDIQMQKFNGLALAKRLPKQCKIILTTAYHEYAFEGFEMDVVDYLLKPFSQERFSRAVEKAKAMISYELPEDNTAIVTATIKPGEADFIFVRTDFKTVRVRLIDILYIEGTGNYVTIHLHNSKILSLQKMRIFEEHLRRYQFARIHKSYIISLIHIKAIHRSSVAIGNTELPIGDSYKESFSQYLQGNYRQF